MGPGNLASILQEMPRQVSKWNMKRQYYFQLNASVQCLNFLTPTAFLLVVLLCYTTLHSLEHFNVHVTKSWVDNAVTASGFLLFSFGYNTEANKAWGFGFEAEYNFFFISKRTSYVCKLMVLTRNWRCTIFFFKVFTSTPKMFSQMFSLWATSQQTFPSDFFFFSIIGKKP